MLSGKRITVPLDGKPIRDDSKMTAIEDGPLKGELWVGKCVFYEAWDEATNPGEINQVGRKSDLPGGLVFTDVAEYSLTDDLSGEPLDGQLVTIAKREEAT